MKKKHNFNTFLGTLYITTEGFGFVWIEKLKREFLIPSRYIKNALNGDTVEISIENAQRRIAKIIRVVERKLKEIPGVVYVDENGTPFLKPDSKKIHKDILLFSNSRKYEGKKVLVRILDDNLEKPYLEGKVVEVIGDPDDLNVQIKSILLAHNIKTFFPPEVIDEVNKIPDEIPKVEYSIREDWTKANVFTIDPEDARDFDDAISIKKISSSKYEIGVHIADVSYYVNENSLIDKEAKLRGNSTYLPNMVFPMLPEKLSNNLCSLLPNKDRLAFSIIIIMDEKGEVKEFRLAKTIINSKARFTYPEVDLILNDQKKHFLETDLKLLANIALSLREKRLKSGAIGLTSRNTYIELDDQGKPINVKFEDYTTSHIIIEELMVLANTLITEYVLTRIKKPFVFRVHPPPDEDKMKKFALFAKQFGFNISYHNPKSFATSLNKMFNKIATEPLKLDIISYMAVRSLPKATYSPENIGHYGLSLPYYTHFTSPIRRYSDLLVHRLLTRYLFLKNYLPNREDLAQITSHLNETELNSMYAELDTIDLFVSHIMKKYRGKVIKTIVFSLNENFIICKFPKTGASIFIPIFSLTDDLYIYYPDNFVVKGFNYEKKIKIGQQLNVKITQIDYSSRMIFGEVMPDSIDAQFS